MSVQIVRGDARSLPLADDSVDLIVTSPPYFGLRSYQDGGEHYAGQLGDEATPAEFVDALVDCTREWMRVLKPSGSMWVNLGDKYSGAQQQNSGRESSVSSSYYWARTNPKTTGVKAKSLMGIPWRYALRCIDDLGLILRAEVIWSKPNGLPESVTDRVRRSHEQWFHFTLNPRYFSAVDEIREARGPDVGSRPLTWDERKASGVTWTPGHGTRGTHLGQESATDGRKVANPLGKLPGSVWTIPTQPLTVPDHLGIDHFAAYPVEWPKRIIQGWSPSGVCVECGEGRRPIARNDKVLHRPESTPRTRPAPWNREHDTTGLGLDSRVTITGYACACPEPTADTTPAVVIDPFGGTGTTALVAHALGRHGISNDMSADYCRLARWRTSDPTQIAKVRGERRPVEQVPGQADLFGDVA